MKRRNRTSPSRACEIDWGDDDDDIEWDGADLPDGWVEAFRFLQALGEICQSDVIEKLKLGKDFNLEECMTWWSRRLDSSEMEIVRQNDGEYHLISYRSLQHVEAVLRELYVMLESHLERTNKAI